MTPSVLPCQFATPSVAASAAAAGPDADAAVQSSAHDKENFATLVAAERRKCEAEADPENAAGAGALVVAELAPPPADSAPTAVGVDAESNADASARESIAAAPAASGQEPADSASRSAASPGARWSGRAEQPGAFSLRNVLGATSEAIPQEAGQHGAAPATRTTAAVTASTGASNPMATATAARAASLGETVPPAAGERWRAAASPTGSDAPLDGVSPGAQSPARIDSSAGMTASSATAAGSTQPTPQTLTAASSSQAAMPQPAAADAHTGERTAAPTPAAQEPTENVALLARQAATHSTAQASAAASMHDSGNAGSQGTSSPVTPGLAATATHHKSAQSAQPVAGVQADVAAPNAAMGAQASAAESALPQATIPAATTAAAEPGVPQVVPGLTDRNTATDVRAQSATAPASVPDAAATGARPTAPHTPLQTSGPLSVATPASAAAATSTTPEHAATAAAETHSDPALAATPVRSRSLHEMVSAAVTRATGDPAQALLASAPASPASALLPPAPAAMAPGVAQALDIEAAAATQSQITQGLARMVRVGDHAAEIHLDPPELGKVRLRLEVRDNVVTGSIEVEKSGVLTAMQASMPALIGALEKAGIRCDRLDVQLLDPRRDPERRESRRPAHQERDEQAEERDASTATPSPRARAGHGLVDYWL